MGIDEQYEAWLEGEAAAAQAEAENERNKPNLASTSMVLTDDTAFKIGIAIVKFMMGKGVEIPRPVELEKDIQELLGVRDAHTRQKIIKQGWKSPEEVVKLLQEHGEVCRKYGEMDTRHQMCLMSAQILQQAGFRRVEGL